jgi:hypothetical protein
MGKTRDLANLVDYISVDGSGNVTIPTLTGVSGGVTTVTAISATSNANGATISGSNLTLTPATAANGGVITSGTQSIGGLKTLVGTSASDNTGLDSELLTTGSGTNWTGTSFATGYTHTSGVGSTLTSATSVTTGEVYLISFTLSGYAGGDVVTLSFNGTSVANYIASGTYSYYRKSTNTTGISVTVTSSFAGSVVISLKQVTAMSAVTNITNSSGTRAIEFRVSDNIGNTIIGKNTGTKIVTGTYNTAIGDSSLGSVNGSNNIAIGYNVLSLSSGTSSNIAIGNAALSSFTPALSDTSGSNIAIGHSAMANAIGAETVAIGNSAMASGNLYSVGVGTNAGLGGAGNVALGYYSLANTSTNYNVGIGYFAGRYISGGSTANTGATNSIYIGANAYPLAINQANQIVIGFGAVGGGANTTTIGNSSTTQTIIPSPLLLQGQLIVGLGVGADANSVAVGRQALNGTQTGTRNVAIGYSTLGGTHSGSYDNAIGYSALSAATSGGNNTAIGGYAGATITSGANNIIISGNAATPGGLGITTGSHNTIIGQNLIGLSTTLSNNIILADGQGNIRYQWDGTNTILGQSGNVGIGTSSPSYKLDIVANNSTFTSRILNQNTTTDNAGLLVQAGVTAGNEILLLKNAAGSARMVVYANGNVLVGNTTDFGQKFQVNGNVNFYGNTSFQSSTKTTSSGSNLSFDMATDYGQNAGGDNIGGLVVININEANTNVSLGNAVYVGVVINPRGSGGAINQISKVLGGGVSALSVSMSGNSIVVNATMTDSGNYRASMTFVGGGGTS